MLLVLFSSVVVAQRKNPIVASLIETAIPGGGFLELGDIRGAVVSWGGTVTLLVTRDKLKSIGAKTTGPTILLIAFRAACILGVAERISADRQMNGGVSLRFSVPIVNPQKFLRDESKQTDLILKEH